MMRHIDILALGILLLGILVTYQVRDSVLVRLIRQRQQPVRVQHLVVRMPEPPAVPVVFIE